MKDNWSWVDERAFLLGLNGGIARYAATLHLRKVDFHGHPITPWWRARATRLIRDVRRERRGR